MMRRGIKMTALLALTALVTAGVGIASAQDDEKQLGWFDTAELTAVFTGGNSEVSTLCFKNELTRAWESADLAVSVGALRAESTAFTRTAVGVSPVNFQITKDSVTALTAESYYARGQYDRDLNARTCVKGGAKLDHRGGGKLDHPAVEWRG